MDLFDTGLLPMLAEVAPGPFDSPAHLFEVKWDGYRGLAFLDGGTRLHGRRGHDITGQFPALGQLHERARRRRVILDGEIVAVVNGRPSFSALQAGAGHIVYVAFDLLYLDGEALLEKPLLRRRELLSASVTAEPPLLIADAIPEKGRAYFEAVRRAGLEGVMAKEIASPYLPGRRSTHWLKVKAWRDLDAVIAGYTQSQAGDRPFGALVLGAWDGEQFACVGYVGTGFSEQEQRAIRSLLVPRARTPFAPGRGPDPRELRRHGRPVWVEPQVCCRVHYLEITPAGRVRHASFAGLRPDLAPEDCLYPPAGGST